MSMGSLYLYLYWSKIADVNLLHLYLAPPLGVTTSECWRDFWHHKTRVPGLSYRVSACDRRTDGQKRRQHILREHSALKTKTRGRAPCSPPTHSLSACSCIPNFNWIGASRVIPEDHAEFSNLTDFEIFAALSDSTLSAITAISVKFGKGERICMYALSHKFSFLSLTVCSWKCLNEQHARPNFDYVEGSHTIPFTDQGKI